MQRARTFVRLAAQARHCRDGIQRGFECHRVVTVGARDRDDQRGATCVYDDVPFDSSFPRSVGLGPVSCPRGLETLAPSRLARSQSIWSCSRNRRSIAKYSRSHTPATSQSRKRLPLPKPSSSGKCSHGIPVCRTYRMPSGQHGHRPYDVGHLWATARKPESAVPAPHNPLLILRLAIPRRYGGRSLMSRLR